MNLRENIKLTIFIFISIFIVFSSPLIGLTATAKSQPVSFPEIINWKNQPSIEFEQNKKAPLKKDQQLKNAFVVKTTAVDEIQLKFSGGETLQVFPNSKVSVPQISPDTGEISEINIIKGRVRFKAGDHSEKGLHLKSLFFDLKMPLHLDLFATIDMKQPSAKFDMIHGEMEAVYFDFEKKQTVREGESITFIGEREGDSIKYDYLLNGRKAPHGVLQPIEKYDVTSFSTLENLEKKMMLEDLQRKKIKQTELLKKRREYENSFLCRKPFGQRDQCYWKKKNELCYRYRCNVEGQWGDETERPITDSCINEKVSACDY